MYVFLFILKDNVALRPTEQVKMRVRDFYFNIHNILLKRIVIVKINNREFRNVINVINVILSMWYR